MLGGCGGDEEGKGIPRATASALDTQLNGVEQRLAEGSAGACRDILEAPKSRGANEQQVQDLIDSMPDDVDSDVKTALQNSFDPAQAYDLFASTIDFNTAETLVTYKPNASDPSPLLAAALAFIAFSSRSRLRT